MDFSTYFTTIRVKRSFRSHCVRFLGHTELDIKIARKTDRIRDKMPLKCRKSCGKWTNFTGRRRTNCETIHGMNQGRSIFNWLGLGILALLVVGLIWQSGGTRPIDEPQKTVSPAFLTLDLSSPLVAEMSSPVSAALNSPLPEQEPAPVPSSVPTPIPTAVQVHVNDIQLTVLHTNDTWGYLLPCG